MLRQLCSIKSCLLRLCLKAASLFDSESEESDFQGLELIDIGVKKLTAIIEEVTDGNLKRKYERECEGGNFYYDILDKVEAALQEEDPYAYELQRIAIDLVDNTAIEIE